MNPIPESYRKDIDGLRAVAVLFVVIFHINEALIPGGFVGVDMFFVISGYLITAIIVRDRERGIFTFPEFYRRRIKRIFPAMLLVVGVTLVAGLLLFLPEDLEALSWSALASIFSVANIYFTYFLDTSYFAPDSTFIPLLHLWSLGVEEQFYLFWPALLLVLLRWPRLVVPVILVLIGASIALGEALLGAGQFEWAYYMLPTRAFQLAMGAILVFLPVAAFVADRRIGLATAACGAVLCAGSALLLSGELPYPGLHAVPVTVGTALLVAAGQRPNLLSAALSWAPLRWIGLISYSLYLWHWPVLAFQRYFFGELSVPAQLVSFAVMIVLSVLSYRLVERPGRYSDMSLRNVAVRFAAVPMLVIGAMAAYLIGTAGFGPWLGTSSQTIAVVEPARGADYVCQYSQVRASALRADHCVVNPGQERPSILVWGDSHAGHYIGALKAVSEQSGFSFRNIAHSSCPPLTDRPERFVDSRNVERCQTSAANVRDTLDDYATIVLSASWGTYISRQEDAFLSELLSTIRHLSSNGKKVIVLGQIPRIPNFERDCNRKRAKLPLIECNYSASASAIGRTNDRIRGIAAQGGAAYVDFVDVLCPEGVCSDRIGEASVYYDTGHLSSVGSEILGRATIGTPTYRTLESLLR